MPTMGGSCLAPHPPRRDEEGLWRQRILGRCAFLSLPINTTVPVPTPWPALWGNMSPDTAMACIWGQSWLTTRRRHATKETDFRASVSPQEQGLKTHLRTLRLPMDRNKDLEMDKVLSCIAEELLKYLTGHSGQNPHCKGLPRTGNKHLLVRTWIEAVVTLIKRFTALAAFAASLLHLHVSTLLWGIQNPGK